ncbi:MAG: DUF5320 domain-containing protein [Deltaproteobacteria bacterium]|nr:DUF5320 domain-containing protein [Deltaproteobacteria bacterium]
MPGGDGTGPLGWGSITGRGMGLCAGYPTPGFANPVPGRGFGRGFGRGWGMGRGGGWGRRNWFYATGLTGWQRAAYGYPSYGGFAPPAMPYAAPYYPPYQQGLSKEDELNELKYEAEYLEDALDGVKKRLAELEGESAE